jgi:putative PIN family toxin of toxin-antitoxin system
MRLVLDTDIIVAALRSPRGASAALLRAIARGQATMLLSTTLLLEYDAVCRREEHRVAAGLTMPDVVTVLDGLAVLAEPVAVHFLWRPQLRDAGDEMVLETAVNGQAQAVVAFNHRDYGTALTRFGIELLLPAQALRRIET